MASDYSGSSCCKLDLKRDFVLFEVDFLCFRLQQSGKVYNELMTASCQGVKIQKAQND